MMEKFHYTHGKSKVVLPRFNQLPFGVIRRLRHLEEADQFFSLIEEAADEKSLAVIDSMTQDEVVKLMEAWQEDAGVPVEAEASE